MPKQFTILGHICNDTEPSPAPGGVVTYAGIAASNLGFQANIITKCPPAHPYMQVLESHAVHFYTIPTQKNTITTFQNTYDPAGTRTQKLLEQQEPILLSEFKNIKNNIRNFYMQTTARKTCTNSSYHPHLTLKLHLIPSHYCYLAYIFPILKLYARI